MSEKKRTKIYLDTSALWEFYYGGDYGDKIKELMERRDFIIYTGEITLVELGRAAKKRFNQGEIDNKELDMLKKLMILDLLKKSADRKIKFLPITTSVIAQAYRFVFELNLFAMDAIHLALAVINNIPIFITNDRHFAKIPADIIRVVMFKEIDSILRR